MRLKLFSVFAIIYILLLAGFVYEQNLGSYTFNSLGLNFTLPVAIWVVLPTFLLFLFAIFHMSFYGFLKFLKFKHYAGDALKFATLLEALLLDKKPNVSFKSKEFINSSKLCISAFTKLPGGDAKQDLLIKLINDLNEGEVVDLKKYSLSKDNKLFKQNEVNKIYKDENFAKTLLKNKTELKSSLEKKAYKHLLNTAPYSVLKELKLTKSPEDIACIFERFKKGSLTLTPAEADVLLEFNSLSEKEYFYSADALLAGFEPVNLLALFKKLSSKHEEALTSYYYLLAQLGLYEDLSLELAAKEGSFQDFELVVFLHENNKKFSVKTIITQRFKNA